jgi:hypothetical protein
MILAVAGQITPAAAVGAARKHFGVRSRTRARPGPKPPICPRPRAHAFIRRRPLEQVHVCLGVRGLAYASPQRLAALALNNYPRRRPSPALFYKIRERRALVYAVYTFVDFYRDTGLAGITWPAISRNVSEALKRIRDKVQRLDAATVTRQEWQDVREQMRGNLLFPWKAPPPICGICCSRRCISVFTPPRSPYWAKLKSCPSRLLPPRPKRFSARPWCAPRRSGRLRTVPKTFCDPSGSESAVRPGACRTVKITILLIRVFFDMFFFLTNSRYFDNYILYLAWLDTHYMEKGDLLSMATKKKAKKATKKKK